MHTSRDESFDFYHQFSNMSLHGPNTAGSIGPEPPRFLHFSHGPGPSSANTGRHYTGGGRHRNNGGGARNSRQNQFHAPGGPGLPATSPQQQPRPMGQPKDQRPFNGNPHRRGKLPKSQNRPAMSSNRSPDHIVRRGRRGPTATRDGDIAMTDAPPLVEEGIRDIVMRNARSLRIQNQNPKLRTVPIRAPPIPQVANIMLAQVQLISQRREYLLQSAAAMQQLATAMIEIASAGDQGTEIEDVEMTDAPPLYE